MSYKMLTFFKYLLLKQIPDVMPSTSCIDVQHAESILLTHSNLAFGITVSEPSIIPNYQNAVDTMQGIRACHELEDHIFNKHSKNSTFVAFLALNQSKAERMPVLLRLRTGTIDGLTSRVISIIPMLDIFFGHIKLRARHVYHLTSIEGSQSTDTQTKMVKVLNVIPSTSSCRITQENYMTFSTDSIFEFEIGPHDGNFLLDREIGKIKCFDEITNHLSGKLKI
jgi:hypothetical protein